MSSFPLSEFRKLSLYVGFVTCCELGGLANVANVANGSIAKMVEHNFSDTLHKDSAIKT